jgi:hypothetical protein
VLRKIRQISTAQTLLEGGGFKVRRPLPAAGGVHMVDPILMIDEMGPVDYRPGEAVGAPDHPHRGFETVTYMLEGEFEHRDSGGHSGRLKPGDVQWMTAGRGVVHSEMPAAHILKNGGRVHGFQVWVNLPARLKMSAPRYQDVGAESIPEADSDDGLAHVRVIAGEALGVAARIDTHTPIIFQHWTLQPGAVVQQPLPGDHNGLLYIFSGGLESAGTQLHDGQMAVLDAGDRLEMTVPASAPAAAQVLLLGGVPLNEPVARRGPFVMNTNDEINQAVVDYQAGRMGAIDHTPN